MKGKKEKKWWQYLLIIPAILLVDLLALVAAAMADNALAGDGLGHPTPVFFLVVVIIFGLLTIVLILRALVLCLRTIIRTHRETNMEDVNHKQKDMQGRPKAVWHCYIPLMIEMILVIIVVVICFYLEINSFYSNPNHIGFAIPITTFILAGIGLLITVFVAILCTIAAILRARRNKLLNS